MSSIRGKVTLGYLALATGVGGFVLFASADLRYLENRVREGVAISAFRDGVQELRRHEKNYFLHHGAAELDAARALASQLVRTLNDEAGALAGVARGDELPVLRRTMRRYLDLIEQPIEFGQQGGPSAEPGIRAAGHAVSVASDRLAGRERAFLASVLRQSRLALVGGVGMVVLLALAGGHLLYRAVGRPLKRLEDQLQPLAEGRFQAFTQVSGDREIVSFTAALNRMLTELDLRRRQVLQAERLAALGTLASGVAHELNNPLGNISGACQILLEELGGLDALPAGTRVTLLTWLTQIDDETERARRIVRTLLDYSRKPGLKGMPCPLHEVLEKSLLLLRRRLPGEDCVRLDVPADLWVRADPQRLQQVCINLVQNAFDAGAREVRIQARPGLPGDWPPADAGLVVGAGTGRQAVLIRVEDDGPGILPRELDHIFDPFYTTREPGEGTGLGLYIVSEIVQEQEGAIAVRSVPGAGTRFELWLPRGEEV
ncbi:MAG TPA: ATP-binding protein [Thiobacillaceae bacterium]|nr:ATP-binding protein [Thiobacillaceae bacterium]HNU65103.1 ATP-binding protein [Thiobacillaceae bacterium]